MAQRGQRSREIPDFRDERARHGELLGREDVLAEIDGFLRGGEGAWKGGWLLVKGGPGTGKSAILSAWLGPLDAPRWPHHFIRRGHMGWDVPEQIYASLVAQIEERFPELTDKAWVHGRPRGVGRRPARRVRVTGWEAQGVGRGHRRLPRDRG